MEHRKNQFMWGIFLILIGVVFLLGNISRLGMERLWPVFPLAVGVAFCLGYFHNREKYGFLMPGAIFVVVSLLFFFCNFFGWWHMETLWPIFILAPGIGFFAMYSGGIRDQGLLISGGIFSGMAIIFLFISSGLRDYWPVFLIVIGFLLMVLSAHRGTKKEQVQ